MNQEKRERNKNKAFSQELLKVPYRKYYIYYNNNYIMVEKMPLGFFGTKKRM